ncbi:MAG: non-homologous end-joining DNA ligase [Acidimicrobiaceae bacterium]|nr:non-homologous end-joining DNA ligase [Acidimicrobiaceae bacterium]
MTVHPGEEAVWEEPMLAELVKVTEHGRMAEREGGGWQYERKLDGLRCLAVRNGLRVELWSRNRLSYTARFPGVVAALADLPADRFTLDGELVAFDGGRTSFARLQRPDASKPPVYGVFDLLHLLGRDTRHLVLPERQALLRQLLDGAPPALWPVPPLGGGPADLLRKACSDGWEGLVAKRLDSPYRPGRSRDWQKLKCSASQELVIGGWTEPTGSRHGFGALLVGYYDETGGLRYAGKVGTGFDEKTLREIHDTLTGLATGGSPFAERVAERRGVHWARPELVAEVSFTEWTTDGRLRHPAFHGLRDDKDPRTVVRETPA